MDTTPGGRTRMMMTGEHNSTILNEETVSPALPDNVVHVEAL